MTEPQPAEVLRKTTIPEALPSTPTPGTPEAVAAKVLERSAEATWRKDIEIVEGPLIGKKQIVGSREQIGIHRNPDGTKDRAPQEQARYDRHEQATERSHQLLEKGKGYDSFSPAVQRELREAILAVYEIRAPAEFAAMTPAQKKALAERLLKNPKYLESHRTDFGEPLNIELDDEVIAEARRQLEEAELKRDDRQLEVDDFDRQLRLNDAHLAEFEIRQNVKGDKLERLEDLTQREPTLRREITGREEEIDREKTKLEVLEMEHERPTTRALDDIRSEIQDVKRRIRQLEREVAERNDMLRGKEGLEQEEQNVKAEKTRLDKEKRKTELELGKLQAEVNRRRGTLADAELLRAGQEEDLVARFENLLAQTTNEWIKADIDQKMGVVEEQLKDLREQAEELREKAMYDALWKRWTRTRRGKRGIREALVNADLETWMTQGDEAYMRRVFSDAINPETGNRFTPDEAKAMLADKEFMERILPEGLKQLFDRKLKIGGFSQEDVYFITISPSGRGLIEEALATHKEAREAVEGVMGAGALQKRGFWEKFRQQVRKHPWWWLLLLGAPFALGVSAVRMPLEEEELRRV